MFKVELPLRDLYKALSTIWVLADSNDPSEILDHVHVTVTPDKIAFKATDRYVAGTYQVEVGPGWITGGGEALIPAQVIKTAILPQIKQVLRRRVPRERAVVECENHGDHNTWSIVFEDETFTFKSGVKPHQYPDIDRVFPARKGARHQFGLSHGVMDKMMKAAKGYARAAGLNLPGDHIFGFYEEQDPVTWRIVAVDEFRGLIAPFRVPEEYK